MNIYIFNLSSDIGLEDLKKLFAEYGEVQSAEIVNDVISGESRGFGYVDMKDDEEARKAIKGLHNTVVNELTISVQRAEIKIGPKEVFQEDKDNFDIYSFGKN